MESIGGGSTLAQRVHKILVNLHIPEKFKTEKGRVDGKVSDEYET